MNKDGIRQTLREYEATCECERIRIGMEVTEHRNWNPNCPKHGVETKWFKSKYQHSYHKFRFGIPEILGKNCGVCGVPNEEDDVWSFGRQPERLRLREGWSE